MSTTASLSLLVTYPQFLVSYTLAFEFVPNSMDHALGTFNASNMFIFNA